MKITKIVIYIFLLFALGMAVAYAEEQAAGFKKFTAVPDYIQPGITTTFNFVFNAPMDVSVNPGARFIMPDNDSLYLPTYWSDAYTCRLSYSFPNSRESGNADIFLSGLLTREGKSIDEIHVTVKVNESKSSVPGPELGGYMR